MKKLEFTANPNFNTFQPSKGVLVIFLAILGLWTASQSLLVLYTALEWFGKGINKWKSYFGAFLVSWAFTVLLIEASRHRHIVHDITLLVTPLLFAIYRTFIYFISNQISLPLLTFYWLWILAVYLVFPNFLRNEHDQRMALYVVFWVNLLSMLSGIFLGIISGRLYWMNNQGRLIFDFSNPNLYAASWQVSFVIALYFLIHMEGIFKKTITLCFVLCSTMLMYLATSRNTLLFSFCTVVIYALFVNIRNVNKKLGAIIFLFINAIILFFLINPELNMDTINSWSSGRIINWERSLSFYSGNTRFVDFIFTFTGLTGVQRLPLESIPNLNSDDSGFARYLFDNSYISLLLNNGLIGMMLFLLPLFTLFWRTFICTISTNGVQRRKFALALGCWVGVFAQMIPSPYIPSFGSVLNIMVMVLLIPIVYSPLQSDYMSSQL